MDRYYRETHANVHRGVHTLSEEATAAYEGARAKVSNFIGACCPKEVIWTRNATEAINLVAYSWGRANLKHGDRVLLTEMEHHANLVPWQILAAEKGVELDFVRVADNGTLILDDLPKLLTPKTKLFGFTAASNVLGTLNPVKELTRAAHKVGALVLVDACQAVPHMPFDVQDLDIDFAAFSGHKMLGPTGIGVLWGRREILNAMPPFMGGGDMIREVKLRQSKWNELPWKFEAGTPAIAEAIGLGAAVDYLSALGMDNVYAAEHELVTYAMEQMQDIEGLRMLGPQRRAHRAGQLHPGQRPSARHRGRARQPGHRRPRRPSLRAAAARALRRPGQRPRQLLHLQYPRGSRRPRRRPAARSPSTSVSSAARRIASCGGSASMDLYAEEILDHYKHPRHFGHLDEPTLVYHDRNPLCGDEITLELKIEDGKVVDVGVHRPRLRHQPGRGLHDVGRDHRQVAGQSSGATTRRDILDLLGIEVGPVRIKCALLPLKAMKAAVWGLTEDEGEE